MEKILEEYDRIERKGLDEYEIRSAFHALKGKVSDEVLSYEDLGWMLVFSSKENDWGTHHGPMFVGHDANGARVENPDKSYITRGAVEHWQHRYREVENPFFKVRYCGLVWDYYNLLPDQRKPADLYEQYTNALLELVRGGYLKYKVIGRGYLERALELVHTNPAKLAEWKLVLHGYVTSEPIESTKIGIWCAEMEFIHQSRNLFSKTEKQTAVELIKQRYSHFETGTDFYLLKEISDLMFEYYLCHGLKEQARAVVLDIEQKVSTNPTLDALRKEVFYEQIAGKYRQLGCREDEQRVLAAMAVAANESILQLQKIEIPIEITKEQWEDWMMKMTSGDAETQREFFTLYFISDKDKAEKELSELANAHPFRFGIVTRLHIGDMPGSVILPYDIDKEGNLIYHLAQEMQVSDMFLTTLLRKHVQSGVISQSVLDEQIENSILVRGDRKEDLKDVVKLYFEKNYVAFCHQVVPQIESMIRVLLQELGANVLKPQRRGSGFQLRTLDDILHEPIIDEVFSCDKDDKRVSTYLRVVLTDQRGCNYRNLICHGVISPKMLNESVAGRLLHVLMLMLRVHEEVVKE